MTTTSHTLGIIMDPIEGINPKKDTTLGILEAAERRGWNVYYFTQHELYLRDGHAKAHARRLSVSLSTQNWFSFDSPVREIALDELDVILIRIDPPVDLEYLYTCHIIEYAQTGNTLIINNPASIRLANEKILAQSFADVCPPTLVSGNNERINDFIHEHKDTVLKPLNEMGGSGIIRIRSTDNDLQNQINQMTHHEQRTILVQRLIPEYIQGDKRILLINGKPVPYALLRVPSAGRLCANLAAGGRGEGIEMSSQDWAICKRIAPKLREMGLFFVGIDIIGDFLTEINITSPTCMRELNSIYEIDIGNDLICEIENQLNEHKV